MGQDRAQPDLQRPEVHVRGRDRRLGRPPRATGRSSRSPTRASGSRPPTRQRLVRALPPRRRRALAHARGLWHRPGARRRARRAARRLGRRRERARARAAASSSACRSARSRPPARSKATTTSSSASRRATWRRRCAGSSPAPRTTTDRGGERPLVLVADDNADMRAYVASLLSDEYRVETAPDGAVALERARARPPDLVLTDVMMPHLDGFGLLRALQEDPLLCNVPVVMVSARAGEEGTIEGLEAGADDYLVKPFSARELLARVRANLELERVRRTRDQLQTSRAMLDQAQRLARVGSWEIDLRDRRGAGFGGVRPPAGDDARGAHRDGRRGGVDADRAPRATPTGSGPRSSRASGAARSTTRSGSPSSPAACSARSARSSTTTTGSRCACAAPTRTSPSSAPPRWRSPRPPPSARPRRASARSPTSSSAASSPRRRSSPPSSTWRRTTRRAWRARRSAATGTT